MIHWGRTSATHSALAASRFQCHRQRKWRVPSCPQPRIELAIDVSVPRLAFPKVRMKQCFLLLGRRLPQYVPTLLQRLLIRRDHPRAPRHDAGPVVDEEVIERGVGRPCARSRREETASRHSAGQSYPGHPSATVRPAPRTSPADARRQRAVTHDGRRLAGSRSQMSRAITMQTGCCTPWKMRVVTSGW